MAEWYFRKRFPKQSVQSAALIEDKREKYNFSPSKEIIEIMREDAIDISSQKITLLTQKHCEEADKIILLLEPLKNTKSEFTIHNTQPIKFLYENFWEKLKIVKIQDPFWENTGQLRQIRNQIKEMIDNI